MIVIEKTLSYEKARDKFIRNNIRRGLALIKTLNQFSRDPTYPSLNLEKLKGSKIWTIRIDRGNRIFFYFINESTALFIDIGKHDKYKRY